jgi:hypothetical protein
MEIEINKVISKKGDLEFVKNIEGKMEEIREMVYIRKEHLVFTNIPLEKETKNFIKKWNWEKFEPIVGYWNGKGYFIADGNHRARALVRMGAGVVPACLLTFREFEYVAGTDKCVPLVIRMGENPQVL